MIGMDGQADADRAAPVLTVALRLPYAAEIE